MTILKPTNQKPPSKDRRAVFLTAENRDKLNRIVQLWRQQTGLRWTQQSVMERFLDLALEGKVEPLAADYRRQLIETERDQGNG